MLACKNCRNKFSGKFCNACGQPSDTPRINGRFVMLELRRTFIHLWDDGLFYTAKGLFMNPGRSIQEYLDGKRVKHMKPFTFLILIVGLYVLLSQYFHLHLVLDDIENHKADELNTLMFTHYTQLQLFLLLCYSTFSLVFFSYKPYNFYEFLVIHTYLAGQRLIIGILLTIPALVLITNPAWVKPVMHFTSIPSYVFMIWAYRYLFRNQSAVKVIAKTILMMLFSVIFAAVIIVLILYSI